MHALSLKNITKRYTNHLAVDNVSIDVPEQCIFGLLGPNGAGKTTLIRIITQIIAPESGEVYINNEKLNSNHIYQIGYLPEERGLYKKMEVGEMVLYFARLKGLSKQEALKRIKEWFIKFEIQGWWKKKVEELSKGMQQKIQFISTVIHNPKLLILDEPFTGFDPINTNIVKDEILKLKNQGATIILSTHRMESVEELCDNITLINKAKKILDGKVTEIRKAYKSNIYEAEFYGKLPDFDNVKDGYEVMESSNGDISLAKIKILNKQSPNELLRTLISHVEVHSFKELIPSMNEIFINTVNLNTEQ